MNDMSAIDRGDSWELPIGGEVVARCCVDRAFSIEFGRNTMKYALRMEGAFSISDGGEVKQLSAERPEALAPALLLFGKEVRSCHAAKRGSLDIAFTDGVRLRVEPDESFEAWEMSGVDGLRMVSGPGGALSVWQPSSPS